MKIYRYIVKVFVAALMVLGIGCSGPRVIPDDILVKIFHDAYIANAYMEECRIRQDSLLIYEPIFQRYGYTMEDLQYTITNFTERKSAMLSDIMGEVNHMLDAESRREAKRMIVLDTIDNVARRRYEQVLLRDTAIVATTEADSTKLQITVPHAQKGLYRINISYTIDKEDKGIGRRYSIDWMRGDSMVRNITNGTLIRGRKGRITAEAWLATSDSLADNIHIDLTRFNLKKNRLKKHPFTIHEIEVIYSLNLEDAQERLLREQSFMRIFSDTMLYLNIDKSTKTE